MAAATAVGAAQFVVNLEVRASEVSPLADVVFPVAPVTEKAGSFVVWEGRVRVFGTIFSHPGSLPDLRVLAGIAEEMDVNLGFRTVEQARAQMTEFGPWDGARPPAPTVPPMTSPMTSTATAPPEGAGGHVLATWKQLIDDGRMLDGEDYLRATARKPVALVSVATLSSLGLTDGDPVAIVNGDRRVTLPVASGDLPDGVVWAPANSAGVSLLRDLGAGAGAVVGLEGGRR